MEKRIRRALVIFTVAAASLSAQQTAVFVNEKPLVGARPPARIGDELFVPLVPVARALGATLTIGRDETVRVRRADGIDIAYEIRTGDIRNGIVLVGHVPKYSTIQWSGDPDQILFPLAGVVAMLSVATREDQDNNALYIEAQPSGPAGQTGPGFALADLDYTYGLLTNFAQYGQYANIRGNGLAGGASLGGYALLSRVPGRGFLSLSQISLRADLPGDRAIIVGDQGNFAGVDAMTAALRGITLQRQWHGFTEGVYGGLAVGSSSAAFGASSVSHYDTLLSGFTLRRRRKLDELAFAGTFFDNTNRRGAALGAGYVRRSAVNQLNVQLAGGIFSGLSSRTFLIASAVTSTVDPLHTPDAAPSAALIDTAGDPLVLGTGSHMIPVHGPAYGFSLSDTVSPISRITVSGQWDYFSKNFLTARDDAQYNAESRRAVSASVRLLQNVTLSAGATDRNYLLGATAGTRSYNYGLNAALPGRYSVQLGYFRSLQFDAASPLGRFSFQQYSVNLPPKKGYSASVLYSETQFGKDKIRNLNAFATADKKHLGQFGATYSAQLKNYQRFGGDWRRTLAGRDSYLRLGFDAIRQNGPADTATTHPAKIAILPLAGLKIPLPHKQSFQLTYYRDTHSQTLQFELGGPMARPSEVVRGPQGAPHVVVLANLAGRVYQDTNYSGSFEPPSDRGIPDVAVWLDNTTMVKTDGQGNYRFSGVEPGGHRLRADLDHVPAGYVFAETGEHNEAIMPYRDNRRDFAVIKTSKIRGRVTYLDYSADPDSPVRKPFPDAHIVAPGGRDTYSELDGMFLLGDLPPQSYTLHIDPESIPPGYVALPATVSVDTRSGETATAAFELMIPPRPVLQMPAPDQRVELYTPGPK